MQTRRYADIELIRRQHAELSRGLRRARGELAEASFARDEVLRTIRLEEICPEFRAADAVYRQARETRNVMHTAVQTAAEKLKKLERN